MQRAQLARIVFISAIAGLWLLASQVVEADRQEDIETILAEEDLIGIAWSLIADAGEVTIGTAGLQDNVSGAAFSADTRFHVGSLTKVLLATGVLRLATQGRVNLDAPARHYLPDMSFDNPWAGVSDVTVRHLLDHTSGLNDAHLWQIFSEQVDPDVSLTEAFPSPRSQLRIRSRPGSRFSYSNMGYTLLGMVIESVVGRRYETYLDEYVLAPLGMRDSTFAYTTQLGENADPRLAWGHVDGGTRYPASSIYLRPAGQFTTTAADLARFAQFLLGDGVIDGRAFVKKSLMRSRGKPVATEAANEGLIAGYALGLARRDRHGVVGYCHSGNIVGFLAMLCIFPDEQKAFAYSVNTDSETANYSRLDSLFIATLNIFEAPPPRTMIPTFDISRWYGRYIPAPNRFQTFEYLDTVFGSVKVSATGDMLNMESMQRRDRRLRPVGDRLYSADDRSTASHVFYRGRDGEYLLSDGFQTFEKVSTAHLVAHWVSLLLGMSGLIWTMIAGSISLIRHRSRMFRRAEAPAFIASALLFLPITFFANQSFMALGDFTLASSLLAVVTLLLPIGMLMTVLLAMKTWEVSRINLFHGMAAFFVIQWCLVLALAGMLPLRLWV
jgi:CubicO group peptidase (beta-lactamase class C family)